MKLSPGALRVVKPDYELIGSVGLETGGGTKLLWPSLLYLVGLLSYGNEEEETVEV